MIKAICDLVLRLARWRIEGDLPDEPKMVVIGAPHTSNWDFVVMLLVAGSRRLRVKWLGKDGLFKKPFGTLMRSLGGIPIQQGRGARIADQVVARFAAEEKMILVIAPEGTRARVEQWRSGFYRIAQGAGVPIVLGFFDTSLRRVGFGPAIWPSDDIRADMDVIREFYSPMRGFKPDLFGPVRLPEEEA